MTKRNHLLEADIEHHIKKARNGKLLEEKEKKYFFNLAIVFLITIVILISLWASLKG